MLRFPRKKSKKTPIALGLGAAMAMGGLFAAYLRWFRPGRAAAGGAPHPGGKAAPPEEAARLASRWHSLDAEPAAAHIPRALEREPKNLDQSHHPGS